MIEVRLRAMMRDYAQRTGIKYTYQQLSEVTAIAKPTLEAIGSRQNYNASLAAVDSLCSALDCSISDLLIYHPKKSVDE